MRFISNYKLQITLFYCTTLVYFLSIGGFFRIFLETLAPYNRFTVALSVLAFLGLLYWFFERILDKGFTGTHFKKILLLYWVTFWFFLFFVSKPWLALFFTVVWLFVLWWQTKAEWGSLGLRVNTLVAAVIGLATVGLYSFATFFNFPMFVLAVFGGILFAGVWLFVPKDSGMTKEATSLPALLATIFLGVQAIWLSRFFPWSITAMSVFFLALLSWLAATRFLGRWSWFVSFVLIFFLIFLLLGARWS